MATPEIRRDLAENPRYLRGAGRMGYQDGGCGLRHSSKPVKFDAAVGAWL